MNVSGAGRTRRPPEAAALWLASRRAAAAQRGGKNASAIRLRTGDSWSALECVFVRRARRQARLRRRRSPP